MNTRHYSSILADLGFDKLAQSRSSTRSNTLDQIHVSSILTVNDQLPGEKLFCLKLKRIFHNKMKSYLQKMKVYTKQSRCLKLLQGKIKRNLKVGFEMILIQSRKQRQDQITSRIDDKKSGRIILGAIEGAIQGNIRQFFQLIKLKCFRHKKLEKFLELLHSKSCKILDHHKLRAMQQLYLKMHQKSLKMNSAQSIARILNKIHPNINKFSYLQIVNHLTSKMNEEISQNKNECKEVVAEFYSNRNSETVGLRQDLKSIKNEIDKESSSRHKIKMDYIRGVNNKKQELKDFSKKMTKTIEELEKKRDKLEIEYQSYRLNYQKRLNELSVAHQKQALVLNTFKQIEEIAINKLKEFHKKHQVSSIFSTHSYHLYLNCRYRQMILLYESGKSIIHKKQGIEEEVFLENRHLIEIIRTIITRKIETELSVPLKQCYQLH